VIAKIRIPAQVFRLAQWIFRLGIGGAFIYAGWIKTTDPVGFADSVASFAILPNALISPFALALPIYEIAAGAVLIAGRPRRVGALALLFLTTIFCVALVAALARGLTVNCGCFGPSASTTNPWIDLARDGLVIAGCALLYRPEWLNCLVTTGPLSGSPLAQDRVYTPPRTK
jgi:putative oxidoreductase